MNRMICLDYKFKVTSFYLIGNFTRSIKMTIALAAKEKLATKEDIAFLKADIEKVKAEIIKWIAGSSYSRFHKISLIAHFF